MFLKTDKAVRITLPFYLTSLTIIVLHFLFHPVRVLGMNTSIFYMDEKYTLASFLMTVTAFLTGFFFLAFSKKGKKGIAKAADLATGIFFIALSLDEFFEIHEYANTLIKQQLSLSTPLGLLSNFSWIFPLSIPIFLVFVLLIYKIINEKDSHVKKYLILGTLSFVIVLIFELIGSITFGYDIFVYAVAVEEGFEMLGVSFFLTASLLYFLKGR